MKRLPIIFILSIIFFLPANKTKHAEKVKRFFTCRFFESVTNKAVSIDSLTVFATPGWVSYGQPLYDNRKNISNVILPKQSRTSQSVRHEIE